MLLRFFVSRRYDITESWRLEVLGSILWAMLLIPVLLPLSGLGLMVKKSPCNALTKGGIRDEYHQLYDVYKIYHYISSKRKEWHALTGPSVP